MNRFGAFYDHHRDQLFAYLLRMTGDYHLSADIMQESFTRYFERYKDRDLSTSLLFSIGRNLVIDNIREERNNTPYEEGKHARHQQL